MFSPHCRFVVAAMLSFERFIVSLITLPYRHAVFAAPLPGRRATAVEAI
jgi:hypothetical protein